MMKTDRQIGVFLLLLFVLVPLFAAAAPPAVPAYVQEKYDEKPVRVGLWTNLEIPMARIQALKGDWKVVLHPIPIASATEAILSEETVLELAEGEHLNLEGTTRGILANTSTGQEFNARFASVELSKGELVNIEIPRKQPQIFKGRLDVRAVDKLMEFQNIIPLGSYLVSAVSETSPSSEPEAIKAHILAARTTLAYGLVVPRHASETYQFCDQNHCYPFRGIERDRGLVQALVEETKNEVLLSKGSLFLPQVQHTCGGKISSGKDIFGLPDEIHLAKEDKIGGAGAENCFHSAAFVWVREFPKEEMSSFLAVTYAGGSDNIFTSWEPLKTDPCGRITEIKVSGTRERVIPGLVFLSLLTEHFGFNSFKSLKFTLQSMRRTTIYRGVGQGLGVGMCLMGADGLARRGVGYKEILGFYYSKVSLSSNPSSILPLITNVQELGSAQERPKK